MGWEIYLKVLGATLAIVGVFLVVVYALKRGRVGGFSREGLIRIKEVKPLGFRSQLVLVEVRDCCLLLGLTEKGWILLKEWREEDHG